MRSRLSVLVGATVALLVLPAAPAVACSLGGSGPGEYVVLGDSYASGEGVNPLGRLATHTDPLKLAA